MTDDLIGRVEAQTAIQFAAKRYTVAHEAHGEGQVVWSDNLINVIDAMNVLRDLPSAQPEQRWIPVSERLPEEDGSYWVCGRWGSGKIAVGDCEYSTEDGYFQAAWNFDVLAWMLLPEPYQEGEQK